MSVNRIFQNQQNNNGQNCQMCYGEFSYYVPCQGALRHESCHNCFRRFPVHPSLRASQQDDPDYVPNSNEEDSDQEEEENVEEEDIPDSVDVMADTSRVVDLEEEDDEGEEEEEEEEEENNDINNPHFKNCPICMNYYCILCQNQLLFMTLYDGRTRMEATSFPLTSHFFNNNIFERDVLRNYMTANNLDFPKLYDDIIDLVKRKKITRLNGPMNVSNLNAFISRDDFVESLTTTKVCFECIQIFYSALLYDYREYIAPQLPQAIQSRNNCWYGKNCRTQSKFSHAARLNHICEQTHF